jgi:hypothetical protein
MEAKRYGWMEAVRMALGEGEAVRMGELQRVAVADARLEGQRERTTPFPPIR